MWVCGCVWMCIKNLCLLQGKMATIQHAPNKAKASCLCGPTFFAEQQIPQAMVKTPIIKKKREIWKNIHAKEVLDLYCLQSHRSWRTLYALLPCGTFVLGTFANCSSSFVTPFLRRDVEPNPHLRIDYNFLKKPTLLFLKCVLINSQQFAFDKR